MKENNNLNYNLCLCKKFKNQLNKRNIKNIFLIILIIIIINLNHLKYILFFNKNYKIIPIAFAVNNIYSYPLIVLLTSILFNSQKNTFYKFYIMFPYDFINNNKRKILYLSRKYHKYKIKFLNLKKKYLNWKTGY